MKLYTRKLGRGITWIYEHNIKPKIITRNYDVKRTLSSLLENPIVLKYPKHIIDVISFGINPSPNYVVSLYRIRKIILYNINFTYFMILFNNKPLVEIIEKFPDFYGKHKLIYGMVRILPSTYHLDEF